MINESIITERDLTLISGHATRDGLIGWLKTNNIPFITAKTGWPRVHIKALEVAMGVRQADDVKVEGPVEFDFSALR